MKKFKLKLYRWLTDHTAYFIDYNGVELHINDYLVGENVDFKISHDVEYEEIETANGIKLDKIVKKIKVYIKYDSTN